MSTQQKASLVMIGCVAVFTICLFPAKEPAVVATQSGQILASVDMVTLSPLMLGRASSRPLYSFIVSPRLNSYTRQTPRDDGVTLLATSVKMADDGSISRKWSFAWGYWMLMDVIPGIVVGFILLRYLRIGGSPRHTAA